MLSANHIKIFFLSGFFVIQQNLLPMAAWLGADIKDTVELNKSVEQHSTLSKKYQAQFARASSFIKKNHESVADACAIGVGLTSLTVLGFKEHGPLNRLISLVLSGGVAYLTHLRGPSFVCNHPGLFARLSPAVIESWLKRKIVEWGIQGYCETNMIHRQEITSSGVHNDTIYFLDSLFSVE